MKNETCENCGAEIGELEQAYIYKSKVVCTECYGRLNKLPQNIPSTKRLVWPKIVLCTIGGLVIGFFAGIIFPKYVGTSGLDFLNSIFKEPKLLDIGSRPKHIEVSGELSQDYFQFKLTNISGKNINGLLGDLFLVDKLGEIHKKWEISYYGPIPVGKTVDDGHIYYILDTSELVHLVEVMNTGNPEFRFVTRRVIYEDGTSETFESTE